MRTCVYVVGINVAVQIYFNLKMWVSDFKNITKQPKPILGAVHMSRASPANRADLGHENLYFYTK